MAPLAIWAWVLPHDLHGRRALQRLRAPVTHLSPVWLHLDPTGQVRQDRDLWLLAYARARRLPVFPLVANAGFDPAIMADLLASPAAREQTAAHLAAVADALAVTGLNLDFEGPFGAYRDQYTDFVADLARRLHAAGRQLSVDVVAKTGPDDPNPLAQPYDYAALAQHCDALIVMGYDYSLDRPGPLAPLGWLEAVITYARRTVPPAKLVIGLPLYSRHWVHCTGHLAQRTDRGYRPLRRLLRLFGQSLRWDAATACLWAEWTDAEGQRHTVYAEDSRTLAPKLGLVQAAGLSQIALWRPGLEDPAVWPLLRRERRRARLAAAAAS